MGRAVVSAPLNMHVFAHPKNRGRVLVLRAYLLMYHLSTNPELLAQTGGAAGAPVYDHDSIANWPIISQNLPCSPMRTGRLSNVSTKMGEPGQTTGTVLAATAIETNDLQVVVMYVPPHLMTGYMICKKTADGDLNPSAFLIFLLT